MIDINIYTIQYWILTLKVFSLPLLMWQIYSGLLTRAFATLFAMLFAASGFAEEHPIATIEHLQDAFNLAPFVEYIEDVGQDISYDTLRTQQTDHLWQRSNTPVFIGKNPAARYWFRVNIVYHNFAEVDKLAPVLYLPVQPNSIFQLDLWLPTDSGAEGEVVRRVSIGSDRAYYSRDIDSQYYGIRLPTELRSFTLIGLIDNSKAGMPALLPLQMLSSYQWQAVHEKNQGILIAFYAIMFALLIYNGCLFVTLRQSLYGYYLLFLTLAALTCALIDDSVLHWVFPESPDICIRISSLNALLMITCYLFFLWRALDGMAFSIAMRRLFQCGMLLGLLAVAHNLLSDSFLLKTNLSQLYGSFATISCLISIIVAMKKRVPTAIYLFIAELFVIVGGSIFMLITHGFVPLTQLTMWSLHGGFLGEALLLSLALAARTRITQEIAINNLRKYETLYQESNDALFQYDLSEENIRCNATFAKLFGYENIEDFHQNIANVTHSAEVKIFLRNIYKALNKTQGSFTGQEFSIHDSKTNTDSWLSLSMRVVVDEAGTPRYAEGSMIDISERKLRESAQRDIYETQKQALANLHLADKLKNEFLATMSHELRTPMNGIQGYLELMRHDDCEPVLREQIAGLADCATEMVALIDHILDFAQLQAGKLRNESELFSLPALLDPLIEKYKNVCQAKNLDFTVNMAELMPSYVWGDKKKISDVIQGLFENAIKFTYEGRIDFQLKVLPAAASEINQTASNSTCVLFRFQDSGIGISLSDRNKIFAAFSQADGSFNRRYGGLGLGLAMCKQIINLMNGTLTLVSEPGRGSRFDFIIDFASIEERVLIKNDVENNPHTPIEPQQINSANVLIVEDNPTSQLVLKGILKKLGLCVEVASNGLKALALLEQSVMEDNKFDLILMDCQMPEMDGFETTRQIRAGQGGHSDVPIIAVTANVLSGDKERCLASGMNDYLKKPIEKQLLQAKICEWLEPKLI